MSLVWIDGEFLESGQAGVSAADRGLLYADGAFTTIRVAVSAPKLLDLHLERLSLTLNYLRIPIPSADFGSVLRELARADAIPNGAARITVTRGKTPGPPRPKVGGEPTVAVALRPLPETLVAAKAVGVACRTLPFPSRAIGLPLQAHKTLAYLPSVTAWLNVCEGEEPLMETTCGHLSEGAASNLFWAKKGVLLTPSLEAGCLPGLARRALLALAKENGVPVAEGLFGKEELGACDEAFLVNCVTGVVPIASLNGVRVGATVPGPLTLLSEELLEGNALNLDSGKGRF